MSKEFGDSGDGWQPDLQPDAPSAKSPAAGPETVRCSCGTAVEPSGKGSCPACGRFLPGNVVALIHGGRRMSLPPERASRRAELRAQVWADLGGTVPPIIGEVAEDFVSACVLRDQLVEHLEAIGPLTQRGTRRAAMDLYLATSARIERLSVPLGVFRDEVKAKTPTSDGITTIRRVIVYPGLDAMPTAALHLARDLLRRQEHGDTLTERELGQLDGLRSAMRGELVLPPDSRSTE
jgi:hypothetical protein